MAVGAGVGASLGLVFLASLAAYIFERRRNSKLRRDLAAAEEWQRAELMSATTGSGSPSSFSGGLSEGGFVGGSTDRRELMAQREGSVGKRGEGGGGIVRKPTVQGYAPNTPMRELDAGREVQVGPLQIDTGREVGR